MAQSKYGRFQPWELSTWVPNILPKTRIFCGFEFPEIVVKRDKNGQKCTKSSKKHPFFHTFIKVWIWPRPLPPLQCGKNPHFLFIFFWTLLLLVSTMESPAKESNFTLFQLGPSVWMNLHCFSMTSWHVGSWSISGPETNTSLWYLEMWGLSAFLVLK